MLKLQILQEYKAFCVHRHFTSFGDDPFPHRAGLLPIDIYSLIHVSRKWWSRVEYAVSSVFEEAQKWLKPCAHTTDDEALSVSRGLMETRVTISLDVRLWADNKYTCASNRSSKWPRKRTFVTGWATLVNVAKGIGNLFALVEPKRRLARCFYSSAFSCRGRATSFYWNTWRDRKDWDHQTNAETEETVVHSRIQWNKHNSIFSYSSKGYRFCDLKQKKS